MEWQEILDKFYRDRNDYTKCRGDRPDIQATIESTRLMLEKLASEEAKSKELYDALKRSQKEHENKLKEEPVKDGFRLRKSELTGLYEFKDHTEDVCYISNTWTKKNRIEFGMMDHPMVLTQEMVRALLPLLNEFVDKGEIG